MKKGIIFHTIIFFSLAGYGQLQHKQIDSLLQSYYPPDQPGAVISIVVKDNPVFQKAYGLADLSTKEPLSIHSRFNIGSLTKQFTAFAILLLEQEKKISLNDSLGKYFTGLSPAIAALTISQLLSHCSGLPDHYQYTDTSRVKHATDKDVLDAVRKENSLYFPAGTHYRYSNTAYCLLGLLIEKGSGLPYPAYMKNEVFNLSRMSETSVFQWNSKIPERVFGYERGTNGRWLRSDAAESVFFSTEADGGIYTSITDYEKWCNLMEGSYFSSNPMVRESWQPHTLIDTAGQLSYGYGWFIYKNAETGLLYHSGSNCGFRSFILLIPSISYRICIFSNRSDIDLEDLAGKINQIMNIPDNSFIKSAPLESFFNSWPIFAPCKETNPYSILFKKSLNAKDMVLN